MEINLSILAETIPEYVKYYKSNSGIALGISDIQLYSPECYEDCASILYLVGRDSLTHFLTAHPQTCFATTYQEDNTLFSHATEYMIFADGVSFEAGFAALRKTFSFYREWENRILHALVEQQRMEDILALCAQPLHNPIALFDTAFVLVATSGNLPPDNLDATWSGVLRAGYFVFTEKDKENERLLWHSPYPFRVNVGDAVKASSSIRYQGQLVGYFGTTDLYAPITDGQLSLLYVIQRIFESNSYLSNIQLLPDRRISALLSRLLLGYNVESSAIDYYLSTLSWRGDNTYQFRLIASASGDKLSTEEAAPTIQSMKPLMGESVLFQFEDCIAVIVKNGHNENSDRAAQLARVLRAMDLICVVSTPFRDFGYLRHAYLQCRMLLPLLEGTAQPGIWEFSDYYQKCVITALADSASLSALCDPSISDIYHKRNGKEFIHSLRIFLMNGKSYSEAAEKLNVHRNTLIYRIEQMEKTLNMDFHQISEQELFRLYLSTLICEL